MKELINPTEVTLEGIGGVMRTYILGDIPYLGGGREVASQFIPTATPKVGDYEANEKLARIMFKFIEVKLDNGSSVRLEQEAIANQHIPDAIIGMKLEAAMLEKCLGFSIAGKLQKFQSGFLEKLPALATKILTQLLDASQKPAKPPTKNSKKATASKT